MKKHLLAVLLAFDIFFMTSAENAIACNVNQTNSYLMQMLFGYNAAHFQMNDNTKMLLDALYLCCGQCDKQGQDKYDYLSSKRVPDIPAFSDINLQEKDLIGCVHVSWEQQDLLHKKEQDSRKKTLKNTVNKVFDFGLVDELFRNGGTKANSFSALLYYLHILCDYLADDPAASTAIVGGYNIPAFSGQPYVELNGNKPMFTKEEKMLKTFSTKYSLPDALHRSGSVFTLVGPDTLASVTEKKAITSITLPGYHYTVYPEIVPAGGAVYNRSHILAHSLGGLDQSSNLVTGTRYMNEVGMEPFERKVKTYIDTSSNHVLYRSTPIYSGDNCICSGVQIEAYSIEDSGAGICFNVYCYNIQPGIEINYLTGKTEICDYTSGKSEIIPFVTYIPSESNPDLIYEINKQLGIIFSEQADSNTYMAMMSDIEAVANEARAVRSRNTTSAQHTTSAQQYVRLKPFQYQYLEVLKNYLPLLLYKQPFFLSAFPIK